MGQTKGKNHSFNICVVVAQDGNLKKYAYGKRAISWFKRRAIGMSPNGIIIKGEHGQKSNYVPKWCVVCGSLEKLTLHHIVPNCYLGSQLNYSYQKNFAILCRECHDEYDNNHAYKLKEFFTDSFLLGNKGIGASIAYEGLQEEFFVVWMEHFLKIMKPRFLPISWDSL